MMLIKEVIGFDLFSVRSVKRDRSKKGEGVRADAPRVNGTSDPRRSEMRRFHVVLGLLAAVALAGSAFGADHDLARGS